MEGNPDTGRELVLSFLVESALLEHRVCNCQKVRTLVSRPPSATCDHLTLVKSVILSEFQFLQLKTDHQQIVFLF